MNVILKQEKYLAETLFKPLFKKGDNSECGNHKGNSPVSVGSKFLRMIILFDLEIL